MERGSRIFFIPKQSLPLTKENRKDLSVIALPSEYKHVAGLAVSENQKLYAVDYRTNVLITIDLARAFANAGMVVRSYPIALEGGLSGLALSCIKNGSGEEISLVGISGFGILGKCDTALFEECNLVRNSEEEAAPWCTYKNSGYSQGLTFLEFDGTTYFVEAMNKGWAEGLGITSYVPYGFGTPYSLPSIKPQTDYLNFFDLEDLLAAKSPEEALTFTLPGPGPMIEDLAWDGEYLYTTDEMFYGLYRGTLTTDCE